MLSKNVFCLISICSKGRKYWVLINPVNPRKMEQKIRESFISNRRNVGISTVSLHIQNANIKKKPRGDVRPYLLLLFGKTKSRISVSAYT